MSDVDQPAHMLEDLETRELLESGKSITQQSIMEDLLRVREEVTSNQTVDIDIPGYKGLLVARYNLLPGEEVDKIGKRAQRQYKNRDQRADMILAFSCDTLIAAVEGLYYRDDDAQLHAIKWDDVPVRYDTNAAAFLKLTGPDGEPLQSARQIIQALFGYNDIAVIDHNMRLARWMRDTGTDVSAELLGEF